MRTSKILLFSVAASVLAACGGTVGDTVTFRSTADRHCRGALNYLMKGTEYDVVKSDAARRDLGDRGIVSVQTILYQEGSAQRLFTCYYPASGKPPATGFTFKGQPVPPGEAAAANEAGSRR